MVDEQFYDFEHLSDDLKIVVGQLGIQDDPVKIRIFMDCLVSTVKSAMRGAIETLSEEFEL